MAQNEEGRLPQVNDEVDQTTLVKALREKVESQMTLIQELQLALQQLEREKEEREID